MALNFQQIHQDITNVKVGILVIKFFTKDFFIVLS